MKTTSRKKAEYKAMGYRDGLAMSNYRLCKVYDAIFEYSYTGDVDLLLEYYEEKPHPAYMDGIEEAYQARGAT